MPGTGAGALREQLVIQENAPDPFVVSSLTRTNAIATAVTTAPHGYTSGDFVTVAGATPTGYNGRFKIIVTGPTTFTYPVPGTLATPATGAITVTYFSDAAGGKKVGWTTFVTVWGELIPVKAWEHLQVAALQGQLDYRFRIHARGDITNQMRILWTPQWPGGQRQHTLEISGVLPEGDGKRFEVIEAGEAA